MKMLYRAKCRKSVINHFLAYSPCLIHKVHGEGFFELTQTSLSAHPIVELTQCFVLRFPLRVQNFFLVICLRLSISLVEDLQVLPSFLVSGVFDESFVSSPGEVRAEFFYLPLASPSEQFNRLLVVGLSLITGHNLTLTCEQFHLH